MRTLAILSASIIVLAACSGGNPVEASPQANTASVIFIHHSIGRVFLEPGAGAMRDSLDVWNGRHQTSVKLWDHDYGEGHPIWGLSNPQGTNLGYAYGDEFNNTIQVDGYRQLFTTSNASRDSLMRNHDVIAFKCGYESGWMWLTSDAELEAAKADYRAMRDFFDQHPEKRFVVVTQPPINCNADYVDARRDRARQLANYLKSTSFLSGHPNVFCFDLFDRLARPDNASDSCRNTLRYEYEPDHSTADPHPNELAGKDIGPDFALFLYDVAVGSGQTAVQPDLALPLIQLAPAAPNPFNPRTTLRFTLARSARARLSIYDLAGRLVKTLVDGQQATGDHAVTWDGCDTSGRAVATGAYVVRLVAERQETSELMTLVR